MFDFVTLAVESDPRRVLRQLDQMFGGETGLDDLASRPFLSPTAEGELYLLATNFLLYVAMVIITTGVAKIYFPESLERSSVEPRARSYNYRIHAEAQESEDYYGSDAEDGEEEEDEEDEVLDSGDEEDRGLVKGKKAPPAKADAYADFFEFSQERMSKAEVFKRLVMCILMLNLTFVTWGILQERMLTRKYPRYTGEYFNYSYALVFTNRFWTLIMSSMLMLYFRPRASRTTVIYEYSFPAISNMLSSWCQYEALRYISFPATTLFKAFKLAPVMAMGKILGNKSYPVYDYIVALTVGIGVTMFMTSTDNLRIQEGFFSAADEDGNGKAVWTGVMLLFLFLFFDAFTSQFQSRMFQLNADLSMVELMFATSAFSTVLSFVTLLHTKELYPAINFVVEHSEIHLHFWLFSVCSTIGQLVIYYTIKNFGAVVFTLIMTSRIIISIGFSCLMYGHKVTATGFFGLSLVVAGVLYRIRRKAQGKQLVKWEGMQDESRAHELVQEWHEHADM